MNASSRTQRWGIAMSWLVAVLVIAVLHVHYAQKIENSTRSAILRWYPQLLEIDKGVNIWAEHKYPNPPIMALILKPFTLLSPQAAGFTWFYAKVGFALASLLLVFGWFQAAGRPLPVWGKCLTLALCLRPFESDLTHGNVNLFLLFLTVASLSAFLRGRDVVAGILLALGIACKLTPALFVPYFVWKRAWKMLAATLAGLVLFLVAVPSLGLGWQRNLDALESWTNTMVVPYVRDAVVVSEHQNQSLPGFLQRMLTASSSFSVRIEEDRYESVDQHNIVELSPLVPQLLIKSAMLLFALAAVRTCWAPLQGRRDPRWLAEFALVFLGMLIFSERTWKHHCVMLLAPCAVLVQNLTVAKQRRFLTWILILATFLYLLTSTGSMSWHHRLGKLAQVYGAFLWGNVLLLAGILRILSQPPEEKIVIEYYRRRGIPLHDRCAVTLDHRT